MEREKIIEMPVLMTRAMFDSSTINEESRTVEVVFATETPVRGYNWRMEEDYNEVLSFDAGHVRMERLTAGAPLLNNHDRWSGVRGVLGVVESANLGVGEGRAVVRFSKRDEVEPIFQDVKDGILKGISAGYRVHKYERTPPKAEGELPTYRAVDWEPMEISLAPIPADVRSKVRNDEQATYPVIINNIHNERTMEENQKPAAPAAPAPTPDAPVNAEQVRSEALAAERTRAAEILKAVRKAGLGEEFATELIEKGTSLDQARAQIIDKWAANEPPAQRSAHGIQVGADEKDKKRKVMADALILRAAPGTKLVDAAGAAAAREFRGYSMIEMARMAVEDSGVNTRGMSKREIAQIALNLDQSRGYHTTSDFPLLLGETFNRTLRAAYAERARTFQPFVQRAVLPDFREISRVQLSGFLGSMNEIVEGGEYTADTMKEASEKYKLAKYGKKVTITWESIINDDLSAFSRIPAAFASRAAQLQSDIVWGILLNNPLMGDGLNLFEANAHKNTVASGTAINVDNLGIARAAIREQKSLEGTFLNLEPSFLLVGSANEQLALQYSSQNYVAAKSPDINVWAGTLQPIVEPRITGKKWFLACAPGLIDTIETAFLDGEEELFTEQRTGFDVDGYEIKARMVFAAKAIDHRGFFYNPGN